MGHYKQQCEVCGEIFDSLGKRICFTCDLSTPAAPAQGPGEDEEAWKNEMFPCEGGSRCSSHGVCEGCHEKLLYEAGFKRGQKALASLLKASESRAEKLEEALNRVRMFLKNESLDRMDPGDMDDKAREYVDLIWKIRDTLSHSSGEPSELFRLTKE